MQLKRVLEHVRDQNWPGVAIDLVIVVIGVHVSPLIVCLPAQI